MNHFEISDKLESIHRGINSVEKGLRGIRIELQSLKYSEKARPTVKAVLNQLADKTSPLDLLNQFTITKASDKDKTPDPLNACSGPW